MFLHFFIDFKLSEKNVEEIDTERVYILVGPLIFYMLFTLGSTISF